MNAGCSSPDRRNIVNRESTVDPSPRLSARTTGGITVAELAGDLDIAGASALREQFLDLLRPGSGRLVIDLSRVSFCDASGLAMLVNTARRASLLGGFLHLAAVSPQVGRVLQLTGLHRRLAIFPTVQAAATARPATQHSNGASPRARSPERAPGPRSATPGHPGSRPTPEHSARRSPRC
jgi:anti-sigma B factor antagonist